MPTLAHKIRLNPTPEHATYFKQACGTARCVWNWALAEWNRQWQAGGHPNAGALKKQFNATKYTMYPWLKDIHRDAHAHPFADLADAWHRFFTGQNKRRRAVMGLGRLGGSNSLACSAHRWTPAKVAVPSVCLRDEGWPDVILTIVRVMNQGLLGR
jgi:putative transposase